MSIAWNYSAVSQLLWITNPSVSNDVICTGWTCTLIQYNSQFECSVVTQNASHMISFQHSHSTKLSMIIQPWTCDDWQGLGEQICWDMFSSDVEIFYNLLFILFPYIMVSCCVGIWGLWQALLLMGISAFGFRQPFSFCTCSSPVCKVLSCTGQTGIYLCYLSGTIIQGKFNMLMCIIWC